MKKFWLWLPLGLFAALVGVFIHGLTKPESHDIPSQWVGQPMPQFKLPPAASNVPAFASTDLGQGKPRLVNIFASWCVPCAAETPILAELKARGAEIDGIALRDQKPDLDAFLARNGNPYVRIGGDETSSVAIALGSTGVPETYVIDGKGIIRSQHIGALTEDDVPVLLAALSASR